MRYIYRVTIHAAATPDVFEGHFDELSGPAVARTIKALSGWTYDPAPLAAVARAATFPVYGETIVKRAGVEIGRVVVAQVPLWAAA